jgi:Lon protease-like protein
MTIPIFPLQLVAYPGEAIPLHIFESRYRRLIRECETDGTYFAILPVIDKQLFTVGTLMELEKVDHRYEDGSLDIKTLGLAPVRLVEIHIQEDPNIYHTAELERLPYDLDGTPELTAEVLALYLQLHDVLKSEAIKPIDSLRPLSYQVAHYCGLGFAEQAGLLEVRTENDRLTTLKKHLEQLMPTLMAVEDTRELVRQNGHHKVIPGAEFNYDF